MQEGATLQSAEEHDLVCDPLPEPRADPQPKDTFAYVRGERVGWCVAVVGVAQSCT